MTQDPEWSQHICGFPLAIQITKSYDKRLNYLELGKIGLFSGRRKIYYEQIEIEYDERRAFMIG